jgi:hypothetical protein
MRLEEILGMEINAKVELIQTLIPLGLMHVEEELMREVESPGPPRGTAEGRAFPGTTSSRWCSTGRPSGRAARW